MDQGPGDALADIYSRLDAARLEFDTQARRFEDVRVRLQATLDRIRRGRPQREALHHSAFARLQAKLETMPVIEQAKGILMAQTGCGADEAFGMLRRASQRSNVRVRELADRIVGRATAAAAGKLRAGQTSPSGDGPGRPSGDGLRRATTAADAPAPALPSAGTASIIKMTPCV